VSFWWSLREKNRCSKFGNDLKIELNLSLNRSSTTDDVTDEMIVFIIPSSGSTGTPKAIAIDGHYAKILKYSW
jgi:acyl-coenzyme A synthetase/AMP-(fatty) acid ligase